MPKASRSGRERRRRSREVADNLRQESVKAERATTSFTAQYRQYRRRRVLAVALVVLGSVVIVTHVMVHLADITWLPTTGLQDLATGYPVGGALIVLGLVVLGRK